MESYKKTIFKYNMKNWFFKKKKKDEKKKEK